MVETREIATISSAHDFFSGYFSYLRNADYILTNYGAGLTDFYDSMLDKDPHLDSCINTRKLAVEALPWTVEPASEEPKDIEIADFCSRILKRVSNFRQDLHDMLHACVTGFSVSEIIWEAGREVSIKAIKSRKPSRFLFSTDGKLRLKTKGNIYDGVEVPLDKFIVHTFNPQYEDPYGKSLCRSIYWFWLFKKSDMKWWLMGAERGAVPMAVGEYPVGATPDQLAALDDALAGFKSDAYAKMPEGFRVNMIETKVQSLLTKELADFCNKEMAYEVLGQTLTSDTGENGGGSYALGTVHESTRQDLVAADAEALMASINDQLIRPLTLFNFGDVAAYPAFRLHYEPQTDRKVEMEIAQGAVNLGIPVSMTATAKKLGVDIAATEEDTLKRQEPVNPFGIFPGSPQSEEPDPEENPEEDPEENPEIVKAARFVSSNKLRGLRAKEDFNRRLQGDRDRNHIIRLEDAAIKPGQKALDKITTQVEEWLKSIGSLDRAATRANDFKIQREPLQNAITDMMFLAGLHGYHDVFDDQRIPKKFAAVDVSGSGWTPVDPDLAIELFEKKNVMDRSMFDSLLNWAKQRAFTVAGATAEDIQARLRPAILDALSDGSTLADFQKQVGDLLMGPRHTEVVFRTNIQTAYNQAHAEAGFDNRLDDLMPAAQFVAIIDSRTTEICTILNGKIIRKDDLAAGQFVPPLHYNCRSTLVWVFADEFKNIPASSLFGPADLSRLPDNQKPLEGFGWFTPQMGRNA